MNNITIEELNYEEAKAHLGGVVFVAILMVVGFLGNLHVLIVYTFYMKPSNHRIFILVLGTLDFITCIVGMPFIIVDLRNTLTFTMSSACKILRFINYFICAASGFVLVVIATDRYRKICTPLKTQITSRVAKYLCCLVMIVSLLLTWPAPVLYGIADVSTGTNLTGSRCWTEDKPNYDIYQAYFNIILITVVFVVFIALVILYFFIGRVIVRHSRSCVHSNATGNRSSSKSGLNSLTASSTELNMKTRSSLSESGKVEEFKSSPTTTSTQENNSKEFEVSRTTKAENNLIKFNRAKRTTVMFLVITVVFFLSYTPHLTLQIITFIDENFVSKMSFTGSVFHNIFLWTFFINNASNCFIYGFFDRRFRSGIKELYQRLNCRRQP